MSRSEGRQPRFRIRPGARAPSGAASRRTVAAALLLATGMVGCAGGEPASGERSGSPVDVRVSVVRSAPSERSVPATVEAAGTAEIATRVSGVVESVAVDVGSRVSRGDTLATLDDRDVEARIDGARATLEKAEKYHRRIRALARDGAATEQELDDAEAGLEQARAVLEEARAQRAYVVLRAPFDGVVTRREVDPGDLATPGRAVLGLVRTGAVKIVAYLPAELASEVEAGTPATVVEPGTGRRAAAEIVRVSPVLDASTRQLRVEARLGEGGAAGVAPSPGSFVRLRLAGSAPPSLWVPEDAVVRRGQLTGLFVLRADTVRLRWIRVGERRGASVEALAGVSVGEQVVRSPPARLEDGTPAGAVTSRPWRPAGGEDGP